MRKDVYVAQAGFPWQGLLVAGAVFCLYLFRNRQPIKGLVEWFRHGNTTPLPPQRPAVRGRRTTPPSASEPSVHSRARSPTPVHIPSTWKWDEMNRTLNFSVGAHDSRPFAPTEIVEELRTLLRRLREEAITQYRRALRTNSKAEAVSPGWPSFQLAIGRAWIPYELSPRGIEAAINRLTAIRVSHGRAILDDPKWRPLTTIGWTQLSPHIDVAHNALSRLAQDLFPLP